MTDEDILITVKDFRVVGICRTSRKWFERYGRNWEDLRKGIPLSWFKSLGVNDRQVAALEATAKRRLGIG